MGCVHSNSNYEITPIYPSALYSEVDYEIVELWNEFLRGNCPSWKGMVEANETDRKTPAVFWSDDFKNRLVSNIALSNPWIAAELESRPIKATARTLCELMKIVLLKTVLVDDNESIISSGNDDDDDEVKKKKKATAALQMEAEHKQFVSISKHHIKWQVDDASYLCVENALMDTLRTCLGNAFLPRYEVRLRYKYGCLKQALEKVQAKYEKDNPQESLKLRSQGELRIDELQEIQRNKIKEEEEEEEEEVRKQEYGAIVSPKQQQQQKPPPERPPLTLAMYSVRDLNRNSITNYDPVTQANIAISSRRINSG